MLCLAVRIQEFAAWAQGPLPKVQRFRIQGSGRGLVCVRVLCYSVQRLSVYRVKLSHLGLLLLDLLHRLRVAAHVSKVRIGCLRLRARTARSSNRPSTLNHPKPTLTPSDTSRRAMIRLDVPSRKRHSLRSVFKPALELDV